MRHHSVRHLQALCLATLAAVVAGCGGGNHNDDNTPPLTRPVDCGVHTCGSVQGAPLVPGDTVSTVAGDAREWIDGKGQQAKFYYPRNVATDGANLYVADGSTVRQVILATGEVSTLAGSPGNPGLADGIGAAARLDVWTVAYDGTGTVYFFNASDTGTVLRKLDVATGETTTLPEPLASGCGFADSIVFDNGVIYASCYGGTVIRQLDLNAGTVATIAGSVFEPGLVDGTGADARFYGVAGLTVMNGFLYAADSGNGAVRKIGITGGDFGVVTTLHLTDGHGAAVSYGIYDLAGIANDGTNLYLSLGESHHLARVAPTTGVVTNLAGSASFAGVADGRGAGASFVSPSGMAVFGGTLYVSDSAVGNLRRVNLGNRDVTTLAGMHGAMDGSGTGVRFDGISDMTTDGKNLYVADYNNTIRAMSLTTGAVTTLAGAAYNSGMADGVGAKARFGGVGGITTDGDSVYLFDTENHAIRRLKLATREVTTLAGGTSGSKDGVGAAARFGDDATLTTDGVYVYVADADNSAIRSVEIATGAVTTLAGGEPGSADGIGGAAQFDYPSPVVTDGVNLYVADGNCLIRKVVIDTGATTTVAGTKGVCATADGNGTSAAFDYVDAMTTDGSSLYIAQVDHVVRKLVIATSEVTTVAGASGVEGHQDGPVGTATFSGPSGITTDGHSLFISTTGGDSVIRKIE